MRVSLPEITHLQYLFLTIVAEQNGITAGAIREQLEAQQIRISQPGLSKMAGRLGDLIRPERTGRQLRYRITMAGLRAINGTEAFYKRRIPAPNRKGGGK